MDGFYTIRDGCKLLHVARETLRRWERDGWFPKRMLLAAHSGSRRLPEAGDPRVDRQPTAFVR